MLWESPAFRSVVAEYLAPNAIKDFVKQVTLTQNSKIAAIKAIREHYKPAPSLERLEEAFPKISFTYPNREYLGLVDAKNMVETFWGK